MLHQDLPTISARPVDGANRWVMPVLGAAALLSAAIVFLMFGAIAAAVLAAPWLIEWAITRKPPVPVNLPRLVRPQIGRLQP